MSKFIHKNLNAIAMVFTSICFIVGLFAGNKLVTNRKK